MNPVNKRMLPLQVHCVCLLVLIGANAPLRGEDTPFSVPAGFEVTVYATDELAHDIYSMTLDSKGRVVVAGRGYVKILHDDNGDGKADRATFFAKQPLGGARGMYFDGNDLICTGDNALARYPDRNGDGVADGQREVILNVHVEKDHSANGVIKGPDGWYYVACGNDAVITRSQLTAGSPVEDPRQGTMLRVSPDGQQVEVVADGFRNPYDLAFAADGSLLTVDADGERDQYLPWYAPTRLFDVAQGQHHGWMLPGWIRSWNRPQCYFDNVARMVEIGRGSPTGAVIYQHDQFPERYRNAMFSACWSLGRIYCFPLRTDQESLASELEIFLQPKGNAGFAPVDIAIGSQGEMYIAIGGRGTRGSVFRVEYKNGNAPKSFAAQTDVEKVLAANQPHASWSRANWTPLAKKLGRSAFEEAVLDDSLPELQRIRGIDVLTESFGGVSMNTASQLIRHRSDHLRARLAWSLGRTAGEQTDFRAKILTQLSSDQNVRVRRHAWEALLTLPEQDRNRLPIDWSDLAEESPRRLRAASVAVAAEFDHPVAVQEKNPMAASARLWIRSRRGELTHDDLEVALAALNESNSNATRIELIRLMQLCLGDLRAIPTEPDVYAGYEAQQPLEKRHLFVKQSVPSLIGLLKTNDADIDRETARLLGMLQPNDASLISKLTEFWSEESSVEDDIHYLIVLSRLPGERDQEVTNRTAHALASLHHKMQRGEMFPSRFWPARVGETFDELLRRDPKLSAALVNDELFHLPQQSLFASRLPEGMKQKATERLVSRIDALEDWTTDLVRLTASLPLQRRRELLHELWDHTPLRETIALEIAKTPHASERAMHLEMLKFGQPRTVRDSAQALSKISTHAESGEIAAAIVSLGLYSRETRYNDTAESLDQLLAHWTGEETSPETLAGAARFDRWANWLREKHPEQAKQLDRTTIDLASWLERLDGIDWNTGDAQAGKRVYEQRSCARCHSGHSRLGPDLAGIGGRFSRNDLFTAIVDPNKNVSPAYRVTQIVTTSGQLISGQLLYSSPESSLVQTDPDTTVRVTAAEIETIRKSPFSPMPQGLLREVSDKELADLYAWLKTLAPSSPKQ